MRSRLPPLDTPQLDASQTDILQAIRDSRGGSLDGPFLAWIRSPGLAGPAQELGRHCRYGSALPARLSELAILVTACWWRCDTEWIVHRPIALEAGLTQATLHALKSGQPPEFEQADEALVYRIGRSLYQHRKLDDALYQEALEALGEKALVDLVGVYGYYALVAMTLNAFRMLPEGQPPITFGD